MANYNSFKWGLSLYKQGFLSVSDVINITINQVLFRLTAGYFWLVNKLAGHSGLIILKPTIKTKGPEKKVLISFVLHPLYKMYFIGRIRYYFSINGLTLYIIRAFRDLGYTCHFIHAVDREFKVKDEYSAAVFHVGNFDVINPQLPKNCKTIAFETGAYWPVHNQKELERFHELKVRRGADLKPDRFHGKGAETDFMLNNVSAVVALGDDFTRESFSQFKNLYPLNSAFLPDKYFSQEDLEKKDFGLAKKNFLYFGGGGEVHKGLDLLIEVFSKLPNLNLFLCNNLSENFLKVYKKDLEKSPNIHVLGYIPQRSQGFYQLVKKCAFNVHISCSEGSPGGIIELLQYGIIPLATQESNIDLNGFGFKLQTHNLEEISQAVIKLSELPNEEVKNLANKTRVAAFEKFSDDAFLKNLKHILKEQIQVP